VFCVGSAPWIRETLISAPRAFDNALARWRELYTAAIRQRDENQAISNRPTVPKPQQREADRRVEEAKREIELLLNRSEESVESDFYPYRYLASEGFLPGYNFPRWPHPTWNLEQRPRKRASRYRLN
jgi:hypothetical protein